MSSIQSWISAKFASTLTLSRNSQQALDNGDLQSSIRGLPDVNVDLSENSNTAVTQTSSTYDVASGASFSVERAVWVSNPTSQKSTVDPHNDEENMSLSGNRDKDYYITRLLKIISKPFPTSSKYIPPISTLPISLRRRRHSSVRVSLGIWIAHCICLTEDENERAPETLLYWLCAFEEKEFPTIAQRLIRAEASLANPSKRGHRRPNFQAWVDYEDLFCLPVSPLSRAVIMENLPAALGAGPLERIESRSSVCPIVMAAVLLLPDVLEVLLQYLDPRSEDIRRA
ncbi:hypothetical protein PQX77_006899 [Marasmius sp. AFHP31]|nr:hypothetical protein PQX77_006899 [Marasmius sp. AFHP31]